jgi:hypothetical protein
MLIEIGRLAIAFSTVEERLIDLTAQLIDPYQANSWEQVGPLDFQRLADRMAEIVKQKAKEGGPRGKIAPPLADKIRRELGTLKGKLTVVAKKRSQLFHARWRAAISYDPKTQEQRVVAKAAFSLTHTRRHGQLRRRWWMRDLTAIADEMNAARDALDAFSGLIALHMIEGTITPGGTRRAKTQEKIRARVATVKRETHSG